MMLLDTNLLIYASDGNSLHHGWAREIIADAVSTEGAAINRRVPRRALRWRGGSRDGGRSNPRLGCRDSRRTGGCGGNLRGCIPAIPSTKAAAVRQGLTAHPVAGFFIGAHAQIMGWTLATADTSRIKTYFPSVRLMTP